MSQRLYAGLSILIQYITGSVWYGLLFQKAWVEAANMTLEEASNFSPLVHAFPLLFHLLCHIGITSILKNSNENSRFQGMLWGLKLWIFLVFPCSIHHHAYQNQITLCLIDGTKDLITMLISGFFAGLALESGKIKII